MPGRRPTERWSPAELEVLAEAVLRAPSVHNIQPWRLNFEDGLLVLVERRELELPEHDPQGRDRLLSCGAALANLELAIRVLGHRAHTAEFPDPGRPEVVAAVEPDGPLAPSVSELNRYSAIKRRHSYRRRFSGRSLTRHQIVGLRDAASLNGIEARPVLDEIELGRVADLLVFAAETHQHDRAYQRELSLWTLRDEGHLHGTGLASSARPAGSLPWAGLVRESTALPDREVLKRRLTEETLLAFVTPGDTRHDHLRAGRALQLTWLDAVHEGLVGSVLTQPLHLPEVRAGLSEDLELSGFLQALMRFGFPSGDVPHSPRRSIDELLGTGF
ncbi:Acg family FMN-binding oxidoreductase [Amycolatopsis sp. NPDC058340]|uniref:Acg family FMN-binding oxidoreductase n=1 Tax=Amycolatopsis sp. NPDC058340 TaxID=3346453 RepID=UPI003653EFC6